VLCPSIGADHFEVTEDVRAQFEAEFGVEHITQRDDEHYLIDAPACLVDSLVGIGVRPENIHLSGLCTVCHNNLIHSYRANNEAEKARRNASIICIM
jgi:copper oxidase (laccase) domain-containing protein